jgi:phosphoglucosamine mutase
MRRLFGTDGVRGIANEALDCELSMAIGRALGALLSSGGRYKPTVAVGMDTRISSRMLASALSAGITSVGGNVLMLGVIPTPAVAYLVRKYGAKAGVMISASHNSFEYNGIKIFGEDGRKLSDELEEEIESIALDGEKKPKLAAPQEIGEINEAVGCIDDYIEYLKSTADVSLRGLRIGIDTANGAASVTANRLFTSLGASVRMLCDRPDGININDRCGSTYLDPLKKFVLDEGLDAGIAFDGDADRCLAVDECGNMIDGDVIMAILALDMKARGELTKNTVVGTVMTNFGFQKFCEREEIGFIAAKVGDKYVLEIMEREGYSLGGEQSGHIIIKKHATTGDGQLTALALLSLLKKSGKPLSTLASIMKKYPQHTKNISASEKQKIAFFTDDGIKNVISDAEKKLCDRGRIVARPSGTEPKIRITVECETEGEPERLTSEIVAAIEKRLELY